MTDHSFCACQPILRLKETPDEVQKLHSCRTCICCFHHANALLPGGSFHRDLAWNRNGSGRRSGYGGHNHGHQYKHRHLRVVKTGSDGAFRLSALQPGHYQVTTVATGFSKEVFKGLELTVGQSATYDVHLKVGVASEVVEVTGENVPLIQTEQSQQANTINSLQVQELSNLNRNFTNDVYTLPGVSNSDSTRAQNPGFTGYLTTGFSIGGSNGRNNLSTIDGGENEYGTGQYRVTNLPVDAIQEYQVNRNAFAAEFGFTDGSAINIVTKSGGQKWHGDAFGYFRDQHTEAQNFFNGLEGFPKAFSQNVYMGTSLGGPVVKDKLFFFTAY